MTGIPEPITITIHGKQATYIHRLAETGLYGETPEAAARQLIMQALQHIMRDKLLLPDMSVDEATGSGEVKLREDRGGAPEPWF